MLCSLVGLCTNNMLSSTRTKMASFFKGLGAIPTKKVETLPPEVVLALDAYLDVTNVCQPSHALMHQSRESPLKAEALVLCNKTREICVHASLDYRETIYKVLSILKERVKAELDVCEEKQVWTTRHLRLENARALALANAIGDNEGFFLFEPVDRLDIFANKHKTVGFSEMTEDYAENLKKKIAFEVARSDDEEIRERLQQIPNIIMDWALLNYNRAPSYFSGTGARGQIVVDSIYNAISVFSKVFAPKFDTVKNIRRVIISDDGTMGMDRHLQTVTAPWAHFKTTHSTRRCTNLVRFCDSYKIKTRCFYVLSD